MSASLQYRTRQCAAAERRLPIGDVRIAAGIGSSRPCSGAGRRRTRPLLSRSIGVHALDLPGTRRRAGRATVSEHRRAVEQPDYKLPGTGVGPEDVALAVAVEVAGLHDR